MDSCEEIRENLQNQIFELESLQSVYCNPGEIRIEDVCTVSHIYDFINQKTPITPPNLDFIISIQINNEKFELAVNLSNDYPKTEPEIFVRNHKLTRNQHVNLNRDLNVYMSSLERGEPCIFSAVSWLQDHAENYLTDTKIEVPTTQIKNENLVRYWIYSHHIYSKTKRREIISLANDLKLAGFSLPGKPGVICVEGCTTDCDDWWQTIKSMTWKKIVCKVIEEDKDLKGIKFKKFDKFEEISFQTSGAKCTHTDMGALLKYLDSHNVGYIFKDIFGVEAKNSDHN